MLVEISLLMWDFNRFAADPSLPFAWGAAFLALFYLFQYLIGACGVRLFAGMFGLKSYLSPMILLGVFIAITDYVQTLETVRGTIEASPMFFLIVPVLLDTVLALGVARILQPWGQLPEAKLFPVSTARQSRAAHSYAR
ncbi:hypothetical protein ABI59_22060 [Acidobacteria bacterium Mor1]|nr:hypothetical protein ABI59_22060 [Acidobacteria bacterium Mor1]